MSLKNRLDALRRQTGAVPSPATPAEQEVRARLERLGGRATPRPRETPAQLAKRVGGTLVDEHLILVEQRLPLGTPHGRWSLAQAGESAAPLVELPEHTAYVDTETTGLAGGTGTLAFMVGVAQRQGEQVRLRQWLITAFAGEAAMLAQVRQALADTELLVSYNGKSFDLPLLRDRQRLHRALLPEPAHFDLLHWVRRLYASRWPDCRLSTVERELLGLQRQDDLPGAEAPLAWKEFLTGYPRHRLHRVLDHNRLDLLSMLVLPPLLAQAMRAPLDLGADPAGVAAAWIREGNPERALETLLACRSRLDQRGRLLLALKLRRAGRLAEAVALWEELAAQDCQESLEQLAKYHEHVARDWVRALSYARRLPESAAGRRRRERLARRLGTTTPAASS